ncbi:MAG: DUF4091 domain-containing protein [Victivallales bacterium]|nr:DUF4091 domain-containing protein [Victivallales bacterium]
MKRTLVFSLLFLIATLAVAQQGQVIENPVIDKVCFQGWTLTGAGKANADGTITVKGNGNDCTYWLSKPLTQLKGGETYMVQFLCKSEESNGGCCVTGPVTCNVDVPPPGPEWHLVKNIFAAPTSEEAPAVRLGQWHAKATIQYANLQVVPVFPLYNKYEGIELGDGENIIENEYIFNPSFSEMGRNFSRPLIFNSATFNSNRWVFGKGSQVVYKFSINGKQQLSGVFSAVVNYYAGGTLKVAASKDNQNWVELAEQSTMGSVNAELPKSFFPADTIYLRLSGEASQKTGAKDSDPGAFQINMLTYKATLSGSPTGVRGTTRFVQVQERDDDLKVVLDGYGDVLPGGNNAVQFSVTNTSQKARTLKPAVTLRNAKGESTTFEAKPATISAGVTQAFTVPYELLDAGAWNIQMTLGGDSKYRISTDVVVPDFYSINYGEVLSEGDNAIWWASSGWKISVNRKLPAVKGKALFISAARNEAEAAQLVITPKKALKGVKVIVSDLKSGVFGSKIPASAIDVLKVYYHNVELKTDNTGILGLWPDALPPIKPEGMDVPADFNQPVWIRVNVPKDAKPGLYNGTITVSDASGWKATVPLKVEVYGFTLPDTMTCQPAFGFNVGLAARYHKATTFEQKHLLWENYMAELAKHHVSIYDPGQLSPFKVKVVGNKKPLWNDCTFLADTPTAGSNAMLIKDDSTTANISANYQELIPVPAGGLECSFRFKLAQPGQAIFIVRSFDDTEKWMPGCNQDFRLNGTPNWQTQTVTINAFKPGAKFFLVAFLPHLYRKDGSNTGEMTVADFCLKEKATGKVLIDSSSMRKTDVKDLKLEFDWNGWDRYVEEAITKYHATTIRIPVGGLGSGNFRTRREPALFGFQEGTPEYAHLMPLYFGEIEKHLREKGWLEKAYIYWFDEPDPKDYEFVMNGFRKLKENCPGIRRLLTEQVEPELIGGPNLWCPHKNRTTRQAVETRQADGDQYWWYISTACRAPYTGLFIDHPGTDMRVWLWQTWDYNVQGVLIWASNYWTSAQAYPNSLQNPYLDTMGWVSGAHLMPGTRQPFGNGDGRFIYPPEAAADGTQADFVADAPVGCYRLEMFRDGIEDYEYFVMLKKLLAAKGDKLSAEKRAEYEALLKVPADVSASLTSYTASPAPVEAHREKLARAIVVLSAL